MSTVKSVFECVSLATQLKRDWFRQEPTWGPWFRGHSDATWRLSPKLYRVRHNLDGLGRYLNTVLQSEADIA
jgi:hypothetical protein